MSFLVWSGSDHSERVVEDPSLCTAGIAYTFSDLMTLWYTVSVIIDKPALFHPDTRLEAALFGCPTGERIRTGYHER